MILSETIQIIFERYPIEGDFVSINKISGGLMNNNYILKTTTRKYFIKSIRKDMRDKLKIIYGVESFMKSKNIPAIVMLQARSKEIFVESNGEIYTIYNFIDSDKDTLFLEKDFYTLGEMLGEIHNVGSVDINNFPLIKQFSRPSREIIVSRLQNYRNEIITKPVQDDAEELFLNYIDFKLVTIHKIRKEVVLPNDTLIHGDYNPGNILFDKNTRRIIGVCDWEKTEFAPKAYELARAILYTCYEGKYDSSKSLNNAKSFLSGYRSVISIIAEEIINGFDMRIHRMALSSWLEGKYCKENDSRANHLVEHEMSLVDFYINGNLKKYLTDTLLSC